MLATSLTTRLGAALASGAIALTSFAGTAGAAGFQLSLSDSSGIHVSSSSDGHDDFEHTDLAALCAYVDEHDLDEDDFNGYDIDELCDQVEDRNDHEDCSHGHGSVGGFDFGDWDFDFDDFGDVGDFGDDNDSGYGHASVNADATTTVHNEINAGSRNNVGVNQ